MAALGDLERGRNRLRPGLEVLGHLLRALQEELVRVEAELRLLEGRLGLDAQERGVVVVVVARQVVDVAGADERAADLARKAHDPLIHLVLLGDAVDLDLHVDVLGAQGLDEIVEMGAGVGGALLEDPP